MHRQLTNVVSTDPDFLVGYKAGQQVLVPKGGDAPSPFVFMQLQTPIGIPSSGSVGANGALTLTTAMTNANVYPGFWMYFGAGVVYSGSAAGFYWVVMSSTTLGTIYNNVIANGPARIPDAPVPIVAAGPGAYVQTTSELTAASVILPGNTIGPWGTVTALCAYFCNSSATAKVPRNRYGGFRYQGGSLTTSAGNSHWASFSNIGRPDRQSSYDSVAGDSGTAGGSNLNLSIDSTVAQPLAATLQLGADTDFLFLLRKVVTIYPGGLPA